MAITLLLAVNVLVFVAINAARIVFSLFALKLGASPAVVGSVLAMMYVFPLTLAWPVGVLADRYSARVLLAAGALTGAAGMLVPVFLPSLPSLYVASVALGMAMVLTTVLGQNLVGLMSTEATRTRNFSNYSLTGSTSIFLGPLLAGFVIDHAGHAAACLLVGALMLGAFVALLVGGGVLATARPADAPPRERASLLATLAEPRLARMLLVSSLSQLGNDIFQAFLPVYAHDAGLSASVIGSLMAALAIGSFAVRMGLVRLIGRFGEQRLLMASFIMGAVTFGCVPLTREAVLLGMLAFVFGISLGASQTLTMMLVYSGAPPGRAGETVGLRLMINNLARILGPAVFGAVGTAAGLAAVFWANAALMGASARMTRRAFGKVP